METILAVTLSCLLIVVGELHHQFVMLIRPIRYLSEKLLVDYLQSSLCK